MELLSDLGIVADSRHIMGKGVFIVRKSLHSTQQTVGDTE